MKPPDLNDSELGRLLSYVVAVLVLCIVYLVILLPFSKDASVTVAAIGALTTLTGAIITARALRRSRSGGDRDE